MSGFDRWIKVSRSRLSVARGELRAVYVTEVVRGTQPALDEYLLDHIPAFYRRKDALVRDVEEGRMVTPLLQALSRLPTSESFQESHFAEVLAGIFAIEILKLRLIYSKLSLNTAENENAKKMDLVLYDPKSDPLAIVLGEVKSSTKTAPPANHHKSCFADFFTSFKDYGPSDLEFDLGAAADNVDRLPPSEQQRVRQALLPYGSHDLRVLAFAVISSTTKDETEISTLAKRKSGTQFEADVICVETLPEVIEGTFRRLSQVKKAIEGK